MTIADSIRTCFQKYFDYSGRATRPEFWWFFLFTFVAQAIVGSFLPGILFLVLLSPFLAVSARRLHDTGRSAWWLTPYLVSGLGSMVLAAAALLLAFADDPFFSEVGFDSVDFAALVLPILLGIAVVGICGILPLILCALPGAGGSNRYGPDPLFSPPETDGPSSSPPVTAADESPPEAVADAPRFCAQCGMGLAPGAKFCADCGAAI